jgi:vacuolar-type H+-ATPase subunit F/Vma7
LLKVFTNIEKAKEEWDKIIGSDFLHSSFLEIFYVNHPKIKHLFVIDKDLRLYAHIFELNFDKTSNYINNKLLAFFIKFLNFDILYLTNSFLTNIPAFFSNKQIDIKEFLSVLKHNYSLLIIPDFLFKNISAEMDEFSKIEVDEEMVLEIRNKWNGLDNYISDLRKKYRNKVKKIIDSTSKLEVKSLNSDDLVFYTDNIQDLFTQVINESRFSGPLFNTNSFSLLVKKDIFKVYGYFINNDIVAFSSEIHQDKTLYSYYTGFDKSLNKNFPIYGRILVETIHNAIKLKMNKVILGRTANEFKSNFGAIPIKSYVYIKVKNKYLNILLKPIFKRLTITNWIQRNPFKK